jgi:hypothetical protein
MRQLPCHKVLRLSPIIPGGGDLSPSILSNATTTELRTVDGLLVGLSRSLAVRDAAAFASCDSTRAKKRMSALPVAMTPG